jgi:hypothetical protein
MADGRKKNGGKRPNAGRKPKTDELALIERLSPLDDDAFKQLRDGVKSGDFQCIKMFFEYRFGKPKQTIDNNHSGEMTVNWHEELTD